MINKYYVIEKKYVDVFDIEDYKENLKKNLGYYQNTKTESDFQILPSITENIKEIDLTDIYALALIAVSLECLPAVTEINGYVQALYDYFLKNPDHRLKEVYESLNNDYVNGLRILTSATALAFYEKTFREKGIIDEETVIHYNGWVKEHNKSIAVNNALYNTENNSLKK